MGEPRHRSQQGGFTALSRQLTGWTTNLLATAIVLVLAIGLGRQLVQWWKVQPEDAGTAGASDAVGIDRDASAVVPDSLYFGQTGYALERASVAARREEIIAQLRQLCRDLVGQSTGPLRPLTAGERAFLSRSERQIPVEEDPGRWQMYEFEDGFPLVVVVGFSPGARDLSSHETPASEDDQQLTTGPLAQPGRRVLAWGLAVPAEDQRWTLYTYRAGQQAAPDPNSAEANWLAAMPLPAGCRRTLALRSARGELTVSFVGQGQPEVWRRHFDQWFHDRHWTSDAWQPVEGRWRKRYRSEGELQAVNIQFRHDAAGRLVGLAVMEPRLGSTETNLSN